jgi:hypothetical protein
MRHPFLWFLNFPTRENNKMSQLYLENKAYLLAKYEAWLKTVAPTHKIEKFSDRMKEGIQRCEAAEPNGVLATMGTHDNKGLSDLTKLSLSKAAEHLQPLEWANVNGAANDGLMGFMSREWLEASIKPSALASRMD